MSVTPLSRSSCRICWLIAEGVADIVTAGHAVLVERDAGIGSNYHDAEYREAGAEVLESAEAVYARADLICKVKEPQPEEYGLLREGHANELGQGRFINRPSRITISARSVDGDILVRVGGEVVLVGSGRLDVLPP